MPVLHSDNLIVLNVSPTLLSSSKSSAYTYLRNSKDPAQALFTLIQATMQTLKLKSQVGLIIDRLEMMVALCGPDKTLGFVKQVQNQGAELYPFYAHIDFSQTPRMVKDERATNVFQARLQKLQNGLCKVESHEIKQEKSQAPKLSVVVYASVVKSGCRFVDEMAVFEKTPETPLQLFFKEAAEDTAVVKQKQQAVKASFKIELKDEERKARDAQDTTVYHTGQPKVTLDSKD